jgi:hypothetical protein
LDQITRTDIELLRQSRARARYKDLSPDELQAYQRISAALQQLAQVAVEALGGAQLFDAKLTSGYSVSAGVRGALPRDLWFGAYHRRNLGAFVGMPQVFTIVSGSGVEIGLAATIHPSDFSTKGIKDAVRVAAPRIFQALPAPGSSAATELEARLSAAPGPWFFRRKTRLQPNLADFPSLDAWLGFLRSEDGSKWASGAISRTISAEALDRLGEGGLEALVRSTATLFAPLMASTVPDAAEMGTGLPLFPSDEEPDALPEQDEVVRPGLESFLQRFAEARQGPFTGQAGLPALLERIKAALTRMPALQAHPEVQVSWSLGKGNWATVPWIALMDRRVTTSTQRGFYAVLLFPQDLSGVYLTLNQGVTDVIQALGRGAGRQELQSRAQRARVAVPELTAAGYVLDDTMGLRTNAALAADYESSTIAYKFYAAGAVPSDGEIEADLRAVLDAYARVLQAVPTRAGDAAVKVDEDDDPQVPETAPGAWLWSPGQGASHWDELYEHGLMAIEWDEMGDLRRYPSFEQALEGIKRTYDNDGNPHNQARACFEFAHVVRPGDLVFAKRGRSTIVGHGVVTGDYVYDPSRPSLQHVRAVRWIQRGEWGLDRFLPMKTLTNLRHDRETLAVLQTAIGMADPEPKKPVSVQERKPFTVDDAMRGLFMPRASFERALEVWRHKRNLILQGAPGVGKSFVARRMAYALMGYEDPSRVRTVQFHQAYAYEDFVQGFRPNGGGFELKEGVFLEFCRRALADPNETHVFIIDEINRGNLAKILGELMLLIEPDKRGPDWGVKLAYAKEADARFYVPPNVHLLGMMNTADRSLTMVDYALRRRFAFVSVEPGFAEASFAAHLSDKKVSAGMLAQIRERIGSLNAIIRDDRANLGPGFCIGHSFFAGPPEAEAGQDSLTSEAEAAWYRRVVENEIVPLLEEYWFDDPDKAERWRSTLLA